MQKTLLFSLLAAAVASKACACTKGDVNCLAKCYDLPNPTEEQTQKTNDCINSCTLNDGSDDCFEKCIKQIYKVHETDRSTTKQEPTPTTVTKDSKSTSTDDEPTSTKKDKDTTSTTASEKTTTKPKATTTPSSKSPTSGNVIQPIGGDAISSASFSVMLAAMGAVSYLAL
jgi:cell division septation protein DedD